MQTEFTPAETTKFEGELAIITKKVESVTIESHDDIEKANSVLREVKAFQKDVEDNRTALTKPINDFLKEINAKAKNFSVPAEALEKNIKGKILDFNNAEERKQREKEAEVQRVITNIRSCKTTAELGLIPVVEGEDPRINLARAETQKAILDKIREWAKPTVESEKERIAEDAQIKEAQAQVQSAPVEAPKVKGIREIKVVKIVDESMIPRAYMMPDLKKIEESLKNWVVIAGVVYDTEKTFAVQR